MSTTIHDQNAPGKLGAFSATRPRAHGTSLMRRLRAWRMRAAVMAELSSLSERSLEDIGITRAEIPNIARRAAGL